MTFEKKWREKFNMFINSSHASKYVLQNFVKSSVIVAGKTGKVFLLKTRLDIHSTIVVVQTIDVD